jgi:integrase
VSAARRRPKGTGSIVQRPDGRWQFSVDLGAPADGRRRRKYLYARSRADLMRKVQDEVTRGGGTIQPAAKGTVGELMTSWLRDDVKPNRSGNTYALYEGMWRNHAAPILAHVPLEKFDVQHVERMYTTMRERGASSSVLHRVGVMIAGAIEVAIKRRKYFKPNPYRAVERPRHRHKESRALTLQEARRFLKRARGTEFEALWVLLLTGGLRLSEALGIEWRDVDFKNGALAVRQGLVEINGFVEIGPLKTKSSRRRVELGGLALAALRRRRADAKANGHNSPFVFTTSTGGHPRRSNLRQREFEPILKAAGLANVTIHGLRHSMTTLALAEGVPVKSVAARLGHTTTRLTLDRYGHLVAGGDREAADVLDSLLK